MRFLSCFLVLFYLTYPCPSTCMWGPLMYYIYVVCVSVPFSSRAIKIMYYSRHRHSLDSQSLKSYVALDASDVIEARVLFFLFFLFFFCAFVCVRGYAV